MKDMKTKVFFLMILFITTVGAANAQKNELIGTWKVVDEKLAGMGISQIKIFSDSHFIWVTYDKNGKPLNSGAATYVVEEGKYIETVTINMNQMLIGAKGTYTYKIEGKKLTISGYFEKEGVKIGESSEVWERIE